MNPIDAAKFLSLASLFKAKYNYKQVLEPNKSQSDYYFYKENTKYSLVRISMSSSTNSDEELNKINNVINELINNKKIKKDYTFLDIHLSKCFISGNELFDTVYIYNDHYDGVDVSSCFPDLNDTYFHDDHQIKMFKRNKKSLYFIKERPVTFGIICFCAILYLISFVLSFKYSKSTSLIILGADYKMFTLGLNQYFRLLTMGFNHGSILHLFCNMYSLFIIGGYVEEEFGRFKYIVVLFYSIIIGSLTSGILLDNNMAVGISGGLYGLMFIYLKNIYDKGYINVLSVVPLLIVNIGLNFMTNTAWQAHLGGFMGGLIAYYCIDGKKNYSAHVLALILIVALFYKYLSITSISPIYGGTDYEIIQVIKDFGLKEYANKLSDRLLNAYIKYGGK